MSRHYKLLDTHVPSLSSAVHKNADFRDSLRNPEEKSQERSARESKGVSLSSHSYARLAVFLCIAQNSIPTIIKSDLIKSRKKWRLRGREAKEERKGRRHRRTLLTK